MKNFAEVISKVSPESILYTVVHKPIVDFVRELFSTRIFQLQKMLSIPDVINMSKNMSDFKENLRVFTKGSIETIEKLIMRKWKLTLVWLSQMPTKCLKNSWSSYQND